jgi:2-phosphoglycerate kinase
MGDLMELKTLFANFSKDVLAKIDSVHMYIVDVKNNLSTIKKGHLQRDIAKELEHDKEILTTKLEMRTRYKMEKASRKFLISQVSGSGTQTIAEIATKIVEPKSEISPGGATLGAFNALNI